MRGVPSNNRQQHRSILTKYILPCLLLLSTLSLYFLWTHVSEESAKRVVAELQHETADTIKIMASKLKVRKEQVKEALHALVAPNLEILHEPEPEMPRIEKLSEAVETPRRKRIAYAITMTKDGSFQDGAAVLAYSIMKISKGKEYDVSLIAFVHPDVHSSRGVLRKIGYHVIECPTPINTTAITFDFLREKINKNGCCGAAELIKLNSYRLLQYDRVVHVDADTFFLHPIDELFDREFSLIYTTDPNMATFKKKIEQFPVQGGFIVLRPSVEDYQGIIRVMMTTEFRIHRGWNSSHIGWYWGGMTVQGVLPYYYFRVTQPNRTQIVDRCYYNTMADTPECSTQKTSELKSAHFTVCQKPWTCSPYRTRLCDALWASWFEMRKEAEAFYGLAVRAAPCAKRNYAHMDLDNSKLPPDILFKPDDSPDQLFPLPGAGFIER